MFNLGLTRFLPAPVRPLLVLTVATLRRVITQARQRRETRRTGRNTFPPDAPVTLIGLFASPTGVGQGVRLMWRDLLRRGRAVTAVDVTAALHLPGAQRPEGVLNAKVLETLPPGPIVLHLNPPLYEAMYFLLPHDLRQRSRLVGYWAWELDRVPTAWLVGAEMCDEIWVPSDFVAKSMGQLLGARKPIHVVPHAVDAIPLGPRKTIEQCSAARTRHGLPNDAFLVGYSFAMSSNFERKNPMAAITAFQAAFPARKVRDAVLILRCNDIGSWPPGSAALRAAAAEDARILVVDGETRRMPIRDLYEALDAYLSPHRSEGYGLTLAEAADIGTSVIATGWGLAADIAARPEVATIGWRLVPVEDPQGFYRLSEANWAEPDLIEAAAKLRALYDRRLERGCPC